MVMQMMIAHEEVAKKREFIFDVWVSADDRVSCSFIDCTNCKTCGQSTRITRNVGVTLLGRFLYRWMIRWQSDEKTRFKLICVTKQSERNVLPDR
jgi:hypothetical protein